MTKDLAHRFLDPKSPRQRRYEALRARFVEGCPTEEAARRFGYSHGSFRNLCSQFINAEDPDFLFPAPARVKPLEDGPADGRAERRQRVLELRRQDLSIHDIRRRLAEEGNPLSVGTIQKLLSEAGLSRLPRRRPDQMPAVARAPTADRNALDLAPRQLRTAFGGLFLFAPDLARMDLGAVTANLPGSGMIPAGQACCLQGRFPAGNVIRNCRRTPGPDRIRQDSSLRLLRCALLPICQPTALRTASAESMQLIRIAAEAMCEESRNGIAVAGRNRITSETRRFESRESIGMTAGR